jgi:hypothetical protein
MSEWVQNNGEMKLSGENEALGEKSVPVPLFPPKKKSRAD